MIIRWLSLNPRMPFRKKVILKIKASVLVIILGALAIGALFYTNNLVTEGHDESFRNGFYLGTGLGLIASGAITITMCLRLLKNNEKFKKAEISDSDERERFIVAQSGMWSIFYMYVLLFAGTVISGLYNHLVFLTLLCTLGVFGMITLFSLVIARKKY